MPVVIVGNYYVCDLKHADVASAFGRLPYGAGLAHPLIVCQHDFLVL
jgi:hypothetical protein